MITTPPAVDAAFVQLLGALDAESAELQKLGSHHFHHDAAPRESQGLLRRAKARLQLRDEIARMYKAWQENIPLPPAKVAFVGTDASARSNPVLIRHIKGVSTSEAAKRLGATETKIREWLDAGILKGYRPTGGHWKITRPDLIAFARDHRELL